MCCDRGMGKKRSWAIVTMKEARSELLLLIADAVVQAMVGMLWTFST